MEQFFTKGIIKMIKIAVCDDNADFLDKTLKAAVSLAIKKSNTDPEVRFFTNGMGLLEQFQSGEYFDIVILDIDMPEINGKALAAKLREIDMSFFLVFITAYTEELVNTIPYRINAFISKSEDVIKCAAELARVFSEYDKVKPQREIFEILNNGETVFTAIPLSAIYWFEFSEKTIKMKTITNTYILTEKVFSKIVNEYSKKGFFEIHRNILVNVRKIRSVQETSILTDIGEQLPLSRRKRKALLAAMAGSAISEVL